MAGTRDENVFMARLAEQADRYEDMVNYVKAVAVMGAELSLEERNLLSVAYKNSVGARRSAWRAITTLEQREGAKDKSGPVVELIRGYRSGVEQELNAKCKDVLDILSGNLVPGATSSEAKVFYLKMKGDYCRYLAEFSAGDQHKKCAEDAHSAYSEAMAVAEDLDPTHPVRLGLALNFSVFYYEVYGSPEKACMLAKAAYDSAIKNLNPENQEQYQDGSTIMQLLNDNLALWTSDMQPDGAPAVQDGTEVQDL